MKRQKRDRGERAYSRGYQAALQGRSREACPSGEEAMRQHWLNGWREGKEVNWQAEVAPLQRAG